MISGIIHTSTFKEQFKKYQYNDKFLERYKEFCQKILDVEIELLNLKWKNHKLGGQFQGKWELHLFPDVLIIYEMIGESCLFLQIGSHSDLFG